MTCQSTSKDNSNTIYTQTYDRRPYQLCSTSITSRSVITIDVGDSKCTSTSTDVVKNSSRFHGHHQLMQQHSQDSCPEYQDPEVTHKITPKVNNNNVADKANNDQGNTGKGTSAYIDIFDNASDTSSIHENPATIMQLSRKFRTQMGLVPHAIKQRVNRLSDKRHGYLHKSKQTVAGANTNKTEHNNTVRAAEHYDRDTVDSNDYENADIVDKLSKRLTERFSKKKRPEENTPSDKVMHKVKRDKSFKRISTMKVKNIVSMFEKDENNRAKVHKTRSAPTYQNSPFRAMKPSVIRKTHTLHIPQRMDPQSYLTPINNRNLPNPRRTDAFGYLEPVNFISQEARSTLPSNTYLEITPDNCYENSNISSTYEEVIQRYDPESHSKC